MLHKLKPVPRAIIIGIIVAGGVFAFTAVDFSTFKQKTTDQSAPPAPQVTTVAPPVEQAREPVSAPAQPTQPTQPAEPVNLQSAPVHDAGLANVLGTKN